MKAKTIISSMGRKGSSKNNKKDNHNSIAQWAFGLDKVYEYE